MIPHICPVSRSWRPEGHLRLAIFDLDGTLKKARDPFVYLHKRLGTWEACQGFLAQGLAGELAYEEWLSLDVALWKGVSGSRIDELLRQNPYLPGAQETVLALKQVGVQIALVSNGLDVHARQVQVELGVDHIFANEILFADGRATGQARMHVLENAKGQIVTCLQEELGVAPHECLAVGDSPSDVDMFSKVRLGVAVDPSSDLVREAASLVLDTPDLLPLVQRIDALLPGWIPGRRSHGQGD